MLLKNLLRNIDFESNRDILNVNVKKICINTKNVTNNSLYVCLKGTQVDGHSFANQANNLGANVLVVERFLDVDCVQIKVKDSRQSLALIASNFYGNPVKNLKLIGITGTNGKTTSTYIMKTILEECGYKVGVIGTIGVVVDNKTYKATMTTPDPIEFQKILKKMVKDNIDYVVMEVSAHALDLKKLYGIRFEVGLLTNITQDHLDYFKTFSHYAITKMQFISPTYCNFGVVNLDDKLAKTLYEKYKDSNFCCLGFGVDNQLSIHPLNVCVSNEGISFKIVLDGKTFECKSKLYGNFNLQNILGCIAISQALKLKNELVFNAISKLLPVKGRFNLQKLKNGAFVVIDYAHTPDGLEKVLLTAKEICFGKLFCVFGCGGDRDCLKRPIMGEISAKIADFSVLTSDNPRFEEPKNIIKQIEDGVKKYTNNYICIENRKHAIEYCLKMAEHDDFVVIAGKGAEDYLDIKGKKFHYSDYEEVEKFSKKL